MDRVASIRLVVFLSPLFDLRGWEKNVPASSRGDLNLFKYLNTNSTAPQLCTIPEKIEGSSEGAALAAFRLFGWPILRTAPESERQRNTIASQTKPILLLHSIRCILAKKTNHESERRYAKNVSGCRKSRDGMLRKGRWGKSHIFWWERFRRLPVEAVVSAPKHDEHQQICRIVSPPILRCLL